MSTPDSLAGLSGPSMPGHNFGLGPACLRQNLHQAFGSPARRILFQPVMNLNDLRIETFRQRLGSLPCEIKEKIHTHGEVGRMNQRDLVGSRRDQAALRFRVAGGADDAGCLRRLGRLQHRLGG